MNAASPRGRRRAHRSSASGVTPCAIPSSSSYSGATNVGEPPRQHEAVDHARVRVALDHHVRARAARAPGTARGCPGSRRWSETSYARGAVGLGGEQLGALVRRRRWAEVDPLDVLRNVEQQRAIAERAYAVPDRRRRRPCDRERGTGSSRGSRKPLRPRGTARLAARRRRLVVSRITSRTSAGTRARSRRGRRRAPGSCRPSRSRCGGP